MTNYDNPCTSKPPLSVSFVWHTLDEGKMNIFLNDFRNYLTRDIKHPFSRELNLPTFFYSNRNPKKAPIDLPTDFAQINVIYLFLSDNTLFYKPWHDYIEKIPSEDKFRVIPVAIHNDGQKHTTSGRLESLQMIRAFIWDKKFEKEMAILELSHELFRWGFNNPNTTSLGQNSSIKLFLSHAKRGDTGLKHAEQIKSFIDNTNLKRFFDTYQISPGFKFDDEIENHIKDSTIIAILSDVYSSRYWCQREILTAKDDERPIIVVNSLENYEDRIFPAASNVPSLHVTDAPLSEAEILNILNAALIETIRFSYAKASLIYYQSLGWIDSNAKIVSRPPDIQQVCKFLTELQKDNEIPSDKLKDLHICYPEPPLYAEETEWTKTLGITISTPLWSNNVEEQNYKKSIGISISEYESDGYEQYHLNQDELKRFSQVLTRHLLARQYKLIYGGDLRLDGFTQTILDEARILKDRLKSDDIHVFNYLAWPIYLDEGRKAFANEYFGIIDQIECDPPKDVINDIQNLEIAVKPDCTENKYIWSRSLTNMREKSIQNSDVRIFAGGKLSGYLGKMPGLLEEFLIATEQEKPIFLIGGLGGLTELLCKKILNQDKSFEIEQFKEDWQLTNNAGYQELNQFAKSQEKNHHADYQLINNLLNSVKIDTLSKNCGLEINEYRCLMTTPFIEVAVHLILKGLKNINFSE